MQERLFATLKHLLRADQTVIVAVSGGADSIALLHAMVDYRSTHPLNLYAATFDHRLREDSADDVAYVQQMCAMWDVPCIVGEMDISPQGNIEAVAREKRYRFLGDVAKQVGASVVMTAHHADDQAETVMLHLLRGAGLKGLRGMAGRSPLPYHPELDLVRPMLSLRRDDVLAYCAQHGLTPRDDSTNADLTYTRNRLRHDIIPRLEAIQPEMVTVLNRLADSVSLDYSLIETLTQQTLTTVTREQGEGFLLMDRAVLVDSHPALQRHVLIQAIKEVFPYSSPSNERVQALLFAISMGNTNLRLEFEGGHVTLVYDGVLIGDVEAYLNQTYPYPLMDANESILLTIPNTVTFGRWSVTVTDVQLKDYQACLNLDGATEVSIRTRQAGDMWQPLGMNGQHQKIKRWMIDRKIPQSLRDRIPLIVVDGRIVAVVYGEKWPISEIVKINAENVNLDEKYAFFGIFHEKYNDK